MARHRTKLFVLITDREFRARSSSPTQRPFFSDDWHDVTIAKADDDPDDYPNYGVYWFRFKRGTRKTLRTNAEVTRRILAASVEPDLIALKSGLVEEIEL